MKLFKTNNCMESYSLDFDRFYKKRRKEKGDKNQEYTSPVC